MASDDGPARKGLPPEAYEVIRAANREMPA